MGFCRGGQKYFFQVITNGEISFYQFETKRKNFFLPKFSIKKLIGKYQVSKSTGSNAPLPLF